MPRNFNLRPKFQLPDAAALRDPRFLVRVVLGVLLAANLVAAAFAFHIFNASPEALRASLSSAAIQRQAEQARLDRTRLLASNIDKGKGQGDEFLAKYTASRRYNSSIIIGEINEASKAAGMKMQDATISPLDPIDGSDDLDIMTISVTFEGGYNELVKLVNLLDRSDRFLTIESLTVTPRPAGNVLVVNVKLNTFVREEIEKGQGSAL